MRQIANLRSCVAAAALVLAIAGCASSGTSTLSQEPLEEKSGVRVTAENAGTDSVAMTTGAIIVEDSDTIVISPDIEKGHFHLTITPTNGDEPLFDQDVDGRVMFTQGAEPGSYDVQTSGGGVTGSMLVFAESQDELVAQNDALSEAIEQSEADLDAEPETGETE